MIVWLVPIAIAYIVIASRLSVGKKIALAGCTLVWLVAYFLFA